VGGKQVNTLVDTRQRIFRAARSILLDEGAAALSMRRIGRQVGLTPAAIYRHYASKQELLDEIAIAGLQALESHLRPALDAATPGGRVRRLTDGFLDFAMEQPTYFDFVFLTPGVLRKPLTEELARPMWGTFRESVDQIEACMARGDIRKDDPLLTAILIFSQVHGLVSLYRTKQIGPDPREFRQLYRASVERLLRSLRPASRPHRTHPPVFPRRGKPVATEGVNP